MALNVFRLLPDGDPETGFQPSDLVPPELFTTNDKTELIHESYNNSETGISSGVWKCAPCCEDIEAYPVDEMMTVISGSVTLTNADGSSETFTAGDTFFIAKGTKCIWEITQTLHKFYMISE